MTGRLLGREKIGEGNITDPGRALGASPGCSLVAAARVRVRPTRHPAAACTPPRAPHARTYACACEIQEFRDFLSQSAEWPVLRMAHCRASADRLFPGIGSN